MKRMSFVLGGGIGLLAILACSRPSSAQTVTWSGPDTGPWHTGANWTPAGVPGTGSDVVIDGETGTPRTVNLDSGGNAVNRVTVSTGDTLRVNGSTFLQTSAAGYNINGLLELTGGGNTRLQISAADTVLEGSGEVRLQPGTRINGGGSLLIRGALTGAGNAGSNETMLTVEVSGRLAATLSGQGLTLDPRQRGNDPGLFNQGVLEAVNGGVLSFTGFGGGWFDNSGGTVRAMDGSEVQFSSDASIAYGTLTTEGTGLLRALASHSTYWSELAHTGRTAVGNNGWLRTAGSIANTGTITLEAAGNSTRFFLNGPTTLTGAGKLVMSGSANAHIAGVQDLTHTGGHTIEGQGNVGINETAIVNETGGIIQANVNGAALIIDPRHRGNDPGMINRGVLRARDGGVIQLSGFGGGWFDNTGGTVRAMDGSEVQFSSDASIAYGTLTTEGTGLLRALASHSTYWSELAHTGRTAVGNNGWLRTAGSIANTGTITLEAAGNSTRFFLDAPTTLTGPGRLVMSGSANAHIAGVQDLTHTGGHTIEGQGNVGINETAIVNETGGLVQANVPGATLTIDPRNRDSVNMPGCINRGTLQARDGGVIHLSGFGGGWFDNTGGTVRALEGSEVEFASSASIAYGTLTTEGTGLLRALASHSTYWSELAHTGRTAVGNNGWLRTAGSIANTGTITLEAAGNSTRFFLNAPTTLTGAGKLVMSGSANAHIAGVQDLTHTGGHTIEGQGNVGINETAIVNETGGLVQANVPGATLTIDPGNRDSVNMPGFINRGTLQARDEGILWLTGFGGGWFDNSDGTIRALEGSEVQMADSVSIANGTLASSGSGRFRVMDSRSVYWTGLLHTATTVVNNNAWLRTSGVIGNPGTITLNAAGNSTRLQLEANTTLNGGGKLVMAGVDNDNSHVAGGFLLTSDNHTIEGHGNLGINESAFFNTATGLVNANFPARSLTIDPGGSKLVTNRGILRASNGGDLYLSGFGGGSFDNANGIVEALDGSRVFFVNGAAISGGVFRTSGSGSLILPASQGMTFTASTTNTGLFIAQNNSTVSAGSRLTNSGVMRFVSGANLSSLVLQDNTTLAGGGIIELKGTNARIAGPAVLIVEDQTIRGTGNIGWNEASISVGTKGLVIADVPGGTLNFDPTPIFGFTNEGTLRAENGGILNLSSFGGGDIFVGATGRMEALEGGRIQFDSTTNLINRSGGTLTGGTWFVKGQTAATSLQLPGGNITTNAATIELDGAQAQFAQLAGLTTSSGSLTLRGGATLAPSGTFTNSGALEIGSASSVNAAGAVTLLPGSSLTCHIGGPSAVGSLNSAGPAGQTAIAGRLTIVFDPGFTPAAGNSWTLISGPPAGTFSQVTVLGLPSSLKATLEYTPNFVVVNLSSRDGINFADWASGYPFASPADAAMGADPERDGLTNLIEFALGTHPLEFESDAAPQPVVVTVSGQPHLGLRYWKPAGASRRLGITYSPERSDAAVAWTAADIVPHSTLPADASGREQITVRHTSPLTGKHLMRLRVTQP